MFIVSSIHASGQVSTLTDTIMIREIVVRAKPGTGNISGYTRTVIDSATISMYSLDNLSETISGNVPVYIKTYGPGGIGTISYRGTGPGHTRITWNNIDLNSPMLGQADLSLIPAGFIDEIYFFHGGASLIAGRAGIGGQIDVVTSPDWSSGFNLRTDLETGSFGKYAGFASIRTGNRQFQSVTRYYHQQAVNNFLYINDVAAPDPFTERRRNAETSTNAFMQEIHLRGEKNTGSLFLWYQSSDRNLPAMLLDAYSGGGEKQNDKSFRALLSHEHFSGKNSYRFSVAYVADELHYVNRTASIDSRNNSNTFNLNSKTEIALLEKLRLNIILDNSLVSVNTVNYENRVNRNISTLTISANTSFRNISSLFLLVSDRLVDDRIIMPDFSTGVNIGLPAIRGTNLKLNLSRISRIPSLNDLYWYPGGNKDLKNEYTWSGEASAETQISVMNVDMTSEVTAFCNVIRDLIQWQPGDMSYWTPVNIRNVNTHGLEASINLSFKLKDAETRLKANYSYTRARNSATNDETGLSGNQLIYVPVNILNIILNISVRNISISWTNNYTGRRYTTYDNSVYLPPYLLSDAAIGYKIKFRKNTLSLKLEVENLLNVNYQAIAYYPMPGRAVYFSLSNLIYK